MNTHCSQSCQFDFISIIKVPPRHVYRQVSGYIVKYCRADIWWYSTIFCRYLTIFDDIRRYFADTGRYLPILDDILSISDDIWRYSTIFDDILPILDDICRYLPILLTIFDDIWRYPDTCRYICWGGTCISINSQSIIIYSHPQSMISIKNAFQQCITWFYAHKSI